MSVFVLKNAEQVRETTTMIQQKEIKKLYEKLYEDITKQVSNMGNGNLQKPRLIILQRDIQKRIEQLNEDIKNGVIRNMRTTCNAVVEDTRTFLRRCGFKESDISGAFFYVPDQIVRNIANGNIYQNGWTLSKAIWGYNKQTQYDMNRIVSMGAAEGKSAFEIAKDLEKFVDPTASKASRTINGWRIDKNGNKVKEKFYFGKVDYNAQRLARTMISHAYQQSFEAVNENDPFVIGYRWKTSNFHSRICEICLDRETDDKFGLGRGIFPKDSLPLDHPNGMCTFEAVIEKSMKEIAADIADWYNSPPGTFPDLDRYAEDFMM